MIFFYLLACYFLSSFPLFSLVLSSSCFLFCAFSSSFVFSFILPLLLQFQFPLDLGFFCFCSLIIYFGKFWFIYCFVCLCVVLSLVLFVIVFCPVLPFTQIPWPLNPTSWKQLSTLTSQVSGSESLPGS